MDIERLLKQNGVRTDREIRKFLPRKITREWLRKNLGTDSYDARAASRFLAKPAWDMLSRGGKRWRPLLMLLSCGAVGGRPEKIERYAVIPELIHNGTLIADDIEDGSETRRGRPSIHLAHGLDVAVNLSGALYYLPMLIMKDSKLDKSTKLKIHEMVSHEMLKLHFGQGTDIVWHGENPAITENQYFSMCANKTGALARLAAKMGAALGGGSDRQIRGLGRFAERIGVAFQIQDDVLNLSGSIGKVRGEDITEGKMSLPVIRTLEAAGKKDAGELRKILRSHSSDKKDVLRATRIIRRCGGIEYSKEVSEKIVEKAWREVSPLIAKSRHGEMLRELAAFTVARKI